MCVTRATGFGGAVVLWAASILTGQPPKGEADLAAQREAFADRPRYLYGVGVFWAEWMGKDWSWDSACFERIRRMGGTSVPVNPAWNLVEPEPGKWDFAYIDHQVAEARKRGLEPFAYMGLTPDWALPPDAPKDKPKIGYRFPPGEEYEEAFVRYCTEVASRYKGKVRHYQFWNEPNGCSWVNDGCGNSDGYPRYTRWLKVWYTAMKRADPDCVLGAGGIDYHEGVHKGYEYLEGIYREGGGGYFDAFNIHPYDREGTLHWRAIEDTRRVMVEHGDADKGMWLSEWGWPLNDEPEKSRRIERTLRTLEDPKYFYVTAAMYLCLTDPHDGGYGLCDKDLKPRESYEAFRRAAAGRRGGPDSRAE